MIYTSTSLLVVIAEQIRYVTSMQDAGVQWLCSVQAQRVSGLGRRSEVLVGGAFVSPHRSWICDIENPHTVHTIDTSSRTSMFVQ